MTKRFIKRLVLVLQISVIIFLCLENVSMAFDSNSFAGDLRGNTVSSSSYIAKDGAFVGYNIDRYNNRPLYCYQMSAFVLAGDRPYVQLMNEPYIYGGLLIGVVRDGKGVWLHHFSDRISMYRPGQMEWNLKDSSLEGIEVALEVVPMAATPGMCVRMNVKGSRKTDQIIWAYGGAAQRQKDWLRNLNWAFDVTQNTSLLKMDFLPERSNGNTVKITGDKFMLQPPVCDPDADLEMQFDMHTVAGMCSVESKMFVADAMDWQDPAVLASSKGTDTPLVCGVLDADDVNSKDVFWAFEGFVGDKIPAENTYTNPAIAFAKGIERIRKTTSQVVVDTPDEALNVGVAAACIVTDARFYPPLYTHGAMAWNSTFPGWRALFGPITFGWHKNVKEEAKYYTSYQLKDSDKKTPHSDPTLKYVMESPQSRFYGTGRIHNKDTYFYNFQTQFFDQLCHEWNYTADAELEQLLRPALELHLQWSKDCFDPDNNYVYESYINTWATDSQWYNGGDTVEETAYAYRGHLTAMKMAQRAGDKTAEQRHRGTAEKIKKALVDVLWTDKSGHLGAYREQGGRRRLHEDAWLPSIFLPIDFDMLTMEQAAQCLYYTEWGLEWVEMPFGGRRCWSSNWVPSNWSLRVLQAGDNYHLALAYYKSGLPDTAWELIKGNYLRSMYHSISPGSLGDYYANDFADIADMSPLRTFLRSTVSHLAVAGISWTFLDAAWVSFSTSFTLILNNFQFSVP